MKTPNGIDPKLKNTLDELKPVPTRDPETASRGKARFLAEAASMRALQSSRFPLQKTQSRRFAMNALAAVIVTLVLFFGSTVSAVYASQDALPGTALYPLKLWIEDTRINLTVTSDAEIDLLLQYTQVRVTEINQLAALGVTPPAETQERLEQQLRTAIKLAAEIPGDAEMQAALLRIRSRIELQSEALMEGTPEQVRILLQAQLRNLDEGLIDPAAFRNTIRNQEQGMPTPFVTQAPGGVTTPIPDTTPSGGSSGNDDTPTPGGDQAPTTGPHNPEITPGPSQGSGGNGSGGKP